ncbi:MAG: TonB-dependent receptor [Candidatus Kryptonium sp.]
MKWTVKVFISLLIFSVSYSDVRGKLTGRITDQNKNPIVGANILLVGTNLGAATDFEGRYIILNIPPGTYDVRISSIGYKTKIVQGVKISAGQTTFLNETLEETVIELGREIVVTAERPIVDVRQTSSVSILDKNEISVLPVQELTDIINLQAGVIDGHFRGGRLGEVQYQLDGVSINNPFTNMTNLKIDRSLIEEVQIVSGTFDAEYGQAMSGVVNVVLRSGKEDKLEWNFEAYSGDYYSPDKKKYYPHIDKFNPASIQNFQLNLSGPTFIPATTFLINLRKYYNESYLYGERRFLPTDTSDLEKKIFRPTGDGKLVPLSYTDEWSGHLKITNKSLKNIQISYQAVWNKINGKTYNHAFRLNPEGTKTQKTTSFVHGFELTHTVNPNFFYILNLRQNYFKYTDYVYEDVFDPRYLQAGRPVSDPNYEYGAVIQGVDLSRFLQETNSYIAKLSITNQILKSHLIKAGFEFQTAKIKFGPPGVIVESNIEGKQVLLPKIEGPEIPGVRTYHPRWFSAYIQDKVEFPWLLLRAGVRVEFFDANAKIPSDLQNPANSIEGAPESKLIPTKKKIAIAPRIGVSFPIASETAVYFSYGHFYQLPALNYLFSNSDYSVLKDLQAGGISYGVMGNPDLKPEFTTQYEFGFKTQLNRILGVDISLYYKDIRQLLGVEFVSTYTAAEYARFTNVDFGNVAGFIIAFDYKTGPLSLSLDYTYQTAMGNSSDPRETAIRAEAGEDPRPRLIPLNWDQRHTLNTFIILQKPNNWSLTGIIKFGSGQPYTPTIGTTFGANLEANSARKKNYILVDVRAEKNLKIFGTNVNAFIRIFNLLGTRFVNGFVFTDTGNPDYSLTPAKDAATLIDPSRYYQPRRIEIGLNFNGSLLVKK